MSQSLLNEKQKRLPFRILFVPVGVLYCNEIYFWFVF